MSAKNFVVGHGNDLWFISFAYFVNFKLEILLIDVPMLVDSFSLYKVVNLCMMRLFRICLGFEASFSSLLYI